MKTNIDELTIGQAKQLAAMFAGTTTNEEQAEVDDTIVGQYVIVRSRNEGINAGYLVEAKRGYVILRDARRLWYHKPADKSQSWYEGVANSGLSDDSRISSPVERKVIVEDYSITLCNLFAAKKIREAKSNEQ